MTKKNYKNGMCYNTPMVSPDKLEIAFETLKTRTPPSGITEENYSHALGILYTLIEDKGNDEGPKKETRTKRLKEKLKEKVAKGILPADTLDLLGWDEEPQEWRE